MTIGSDSDSHPHSDVGEGEASEALVPPRRTAGAGSMTPVKSGMKPRPRSKSKSRPRSALSGESGDEVRAVTPESGTGTGKQLEKVAKPTRKGKVMAKQKEKEKTKEGRKETEKVTPRPRSPTRSPLPTSPDTKNAHTPKRQLSVLVPSVPRDYFSSPSVPRTIEGEHEHEIEKKRVDVAATSGPKRKQLVPAASIRAVAAEASTSTSKRGKPSPAKISTTLTTSGKSNPRSKAKAKPKLGASRQMTKTHADDNDEDMNEAEDNDTSIVVDTPATTRLREEIMPDVVIFEKEQKQAKRRRSVGGESVASVRGEDVERVERGGKRRKVVTEEEEEEEAEVEDVVLVPSVKTKPRTTNGKGKSKRTTALGSDEDTDDPPAKNKPSESQEKEARVRGKVFTSIRLMTTGVTLLDDVIKRLTKLGVQMTTKPTDCTHLVAKGIVRTEKLLCAMSVSPYVLTEEWANASAKGGKLLPENDYLLSDTAAEQKWAFKFTDAIARAKGPEGGPSLFKHMTFYVTPKVSVDAKLLKNVVSAGGGQVQTSTMPTARILKGKANRYVVSCQEDKAIWRPLVQEGFKVYSPELVLRGALRQEIEWEREECLVAW
ncbi:hypothetical protein J3R83DRAFT_5384 [Lanmaoa asiatica]|nr:hypothetical protein J3R83DRAFT_5384 [Lanmaoa asiatica]